MKIEALKACLAIARAKRKATVYPVVMLTPVATDLQCVGAEEHHINFYPFYRAKPLV